MADYSEPVSELLRSGKPDFPDWQDYRALGIGEEHIPELIRLATDRSLLFAETETPSVWAPIHAWRALGQLRAEAAVGPLLELVNDNEGDDFSDWITEEVPEVLAKVGPPALPAVASALMDRQRGTYATWNAARTLALLAKAHPETRAECVRALTEGLALQRDDTTANGGTISELLDLKAVEAAGTIEAAFAADLVDESIAGDWPYVRWQLGLGPKPPPRRFQPPFESGGLIVPGPIGPSRTAKERAKARRKQAAKSRKRNRKKK